MEPHRVHSDRLMRHAFEQLEKGDRLQASEKAWGAMAHALKSVAKERGLDYHNHDAAFAVIRRLEGDAKVAPAEMRTGFEVAHRLHQNFYNDIERPGGLEDDLPRIQRGIELLFSNHQRWKRANPHWRAHVGRPDIGQRSRSNGNPVRHMRKF